MAIPRIVTVAVTVSVLALGCNTKSQPPAPVATSPSDAAPTTDGAPGQIVSPLPEDGPHPAYPTPLAAGTDRIFTLEEPDRGEMIAPTFDVKATSAGLTWKTHAYCDPDTADIVCSERAQPPNWRVGRKRDGTVVAIPASPTQDTHVYLAKPDLAPQRYVAIDAYNRVRQASIFQKDRYSSREPDGSNALRGCGSMWFVLDDNRRVVRERCLQWGGDPMRDVRGVAATRYVRDANGFIIETHYEGLDNKPTTAVTGMSMKHHERDRDGREIAITYFDIAGKAVAASDGCHGYRYEYHSTNTVKQETCIDVDDAVTEGSNGVAVVTTRVDPRGCRLGWSHTDANGKPVADDNGLNAIDLKVDKLCAELTRSCLGVGGKLAPCRAGWPAKLVTKRDPLGEPTSVKHYDEYDAPGGDEDYGVFEVRYKHDNLGNEIEDGCFDVDGSPVICGTTEIHSTRSKWDTAGRNVEQSYFDTDYKPTANVGVWITRYTYDNYDHQFEESNHDLAGKFLEVNGQAMRRDLYDPAHRLFGIVMLDQKGSPAKYVGCYTSATCPSGGWHAVRLVRRADSKVETNQFFDQDGQLIYTVDCAEAACFD